DRIWRAITSREQSANFFYETDVELRVGGDFRLLQGNGEAVVSGKVFVCEPPHRLRVSWRELSDPGAVPGEVEYLLEDVGGFTRRTVSTYDEPEPAPEMIDMGRKGWGVMLSSLKSLLETGHPPPEPKA